MIAPVAQSKKSSPIFKKLFDRTQWSVARLAKERKRFAISNGNLKSETEVPVATNERCLSGIQASEQTCITYILSVIVIGSGSL